MRLKEMSYGACETAWKKAGDAIKVDVLKERISFSALDHLDLKGVTGLYPFQVGWRRVKRRVFKDNQYDPPLSQPPHYLHVLAVEHGKAKWVFFCDAKEIFCALAGEFEAAFTHTVCVWPEDDLWSEDGGDVPVVHLGEPQKKVIHQGKKRYNASRFLEEAVAAEGARLEFLYYLLSEAERACEGTVEGCVYTVPGERKDRHYHPEILYPSRAEKCVILDGENLEELRQLLSPLLPERIDAAKGAARVRETYGDGLSRRESVLEAFRRSSSYADAASRIPELRREMALWTGWIADGQAEQSLGEGYLEVLSQKIEILEKLLQAHERDRAAEEKRKRAEEEEQRKQREEEQKRRNSCNDGERSVEYEIKWFCAGRGETVASIAADCESRYRYNCILLAKRDFIQDESQEYDHILVGPGGVLLIETKHWKGGVEIRSDGKWLRCTGENGEKAGVENPKIQVRRHEALMKAIVPGVAVSSVLCFSNASVVIDGREYFQDYPILYTDQLGDYLSRFCESQLYSEAAIRSIVQTIEAHKVNRMPARRD